MNIKLRVSNLIKKYGTADPILLAKSLDIIIVRLPLPDCTRGFLVRCLRKKYILLNEDLEDLAARIVICHEIGHARLHLRYGYYFNPDYTYYVPSKREFEANEFALHLLSNSNEMDCNLITATLQSKKPDPKMVHYLLGALISQ